MLIASIIQELAATTTSVITYFIISKDMAAKFVAIELGDATVH